MQNVKAQKNVERGNSSLALKAGFWYVVSIFLVKAIGFITTPVFARLMNKTDYGEFSNFASWQLTLLIITSAELYSTVSRAYYDFTDGFDRYLSTITLASCGITVIVYIFFLLGQSFVFKIVTIPEKYVHLMFIVLLFQAVKQIFFARERTLYRYKSVATISFANLFIPTIIAILLVVVFPYADHLALRLYGFYVPSAIIGVFCAVLIFTNSKGFNWQYCKYACALSIPLLIHHLTTYLLSATNITVTKAVLGAEITAIVSIANSTIHIVTVFFQAVSGALTTWLMDNLQQKRSDKIRKDSLFYVLLLAVISVGVMLAAPEIVWLLGGKKYSMSMFLVPGFIFAIFIQSVTTIFTIILTYDKNVIGTALSTAAVAIVCILGKIYVLKSFDYGMLPVVNIVAFGVLFICNYLLIKKAGYAGAVNFKIIAASILLMGSIALNVLNLYAYNSLRYGIIAGLFLVFGIIAFIKRKAILSFVKRGKKK